MLLSDGPRRFESRLDLPDTEPTLRPDLIDVLRANPGAWLRTDALPLASAEAIAALTAAGLGGVRVPFHSARPDAHDWLVGGPGACKQTYRALKALVAARAGLEVELTVTRPTAPHLVETVEVLHRLGVRTLRLRRLTDRARAFISLSPRFGLLEPYLESAVALALARDVKVVLEGFPRCAAPRAPASVFEPVEEPSARCPGCTCAGAPADYVRHFGSRELDSEQPRTNARPLEPDPGAAPPARGGRNPATRVRDALPSGALHGDPLADRSATKQPDVLEARLDGLAPRDARVALARLCQERPACLAVSSSDPELLREATRLSVPRVQGRADARSVAGWSDQAIRNLNKLDRLEVGVRAPDELEVVKRVAALTALNVAVRLSPEGGSLDALAERAEGLSVLALPACLQRREKLEPKPPGEFSACPHAARCAAASVCPGLAVGWSSSRLAPVAPE